MKLQIVVLLGVSICFAFQLGQRRSQLVFDRFDNTCGKKNIPMIFSHSDIIIKGNNIVFNGTIEVKRNVSTHLRMMMNMERCKHKENPDTCEQFYNYNSDDYCKLIVSRMDIFGYIFMTFHPKFKCPLQKGVYRSVNTSIDMFAFFLFPTESWYFRTNVEVRNTDNNALVMCAKIAIQMAK